MKTLWTVLNSHPKLILRYDSFISNGSHEFFVTPSQQGIMGEMGLVELSEVVMVCRVERCGMEGR